MQLCSRGVNFSAKISGETVGGGAGEGTEEEEWRQHMRRRRGVEGTEKKEGHTLPSVPSPPYPQEQRSSFALEILNVFHFCSYRNSMIGKKSDWSVDEKLVNA